MYYKKPHLLVLFISFLIWSLFFLYASDLIAESHVTDRFGFIDNGNGTITDTQTGYMWQQMPSSRVKNYDNACTYCESLTLAGFDDWRLPSTNEFKGLLKTDDNIISDVFMPTMGIRKSVWAIGHTQFKKRQAMKFEYYSRFQAYVGWRIAPQRNSTHYVRCVRYAKVRYVKPKNIQQSGIINRSKSENVRTGSAVADNSKSLNSDHVVVGTIIIYTKDGNVIKANSFWEEDGMVKYKKYGATIGIQKELVKEVIYREGTQISKSISNATKISPKYGEKREIQGPKLQGSDMWQLTTAKETIDRLLAIEKINKEEFVDVKAHLEKHRDQIQGFLNILNSGKSLVSTGIETINRYYAWLREYKPIEAQATIIDKAIKEQPYIGVFGEDTFDFAFTLLNNEEWREVSELVKTDRKRAAQLYQYYRERKDLGAHKEWIKEFERRIEVGKLYWKKRRKRQSKCSRKLNRCLERCTAKANFQDLNQCNKFCREDDQWCWEGP